MRKSWWYKFILFLGLTTIAVLQVIPTLFPQIDLENFPIKNRINLGLDLQGGLYMIMGAQFPEVFKENLTRTTETMIKEFKNNEDGTFKIKGFEFIKNSPPLDPQMEIILEDPKNAENFRISLKEIYGTTYKIVLQEGARFVLALSNSQLTFIRTKTIEQAIEVIRNRTDKFGVKEPVITSHGSDKILIELPGVKDVDRAKSIIGKVAKLEFQIVDDESITPAKLAALVVKIEKENKDSFPKKLDLSTYVSNINKFVGKEIPKDTEIAFGRIKDPVTGKETGKLPYLLKKKVDVTGQDLQDAFASIDQQDRFPIVSLNFNYRGTAKFDKLTGDNVGKRLAIVLDGVVYTAPVLQERISQGSARISMGRGNYQDILKEASDIAIILRAGALPAKLEFQEQRVVGPSLGADSIASGRKASLIAFALIFLFMIIYYKFAGCISVVALLLNSLFIFAILVGLGATLTLPGIAGIALTIGMSVDANVIIYERIREELRMGKSAVSALEQGFSYAWATILDANITTAVAALVLMEFGTGPIRGFAVTLLIGIITSLFTAVFVTRMLFDLWIMRPSRKNEAMISI